MGDFVLVHNKILQINTIKGISLYSGSGIKYCSSIKYEAIVR